MPYIYTSDELVTAVKLLGTWPNASNTTAANILQHLSAVLQTQLAPELLATREEYYVFTSRIDLSIPASADGKPLNVYRIPWRAMGNKIRDIYYLASWTGGDRESLEPVDRDDLAKYDVTTTGRPTGYYIEGNYIKFVPAMAALPTSGLLEISYYIMPSDLVTTASARQATTITLSSKTVNFATPIPNTWVVGTKIDIHSQYSGAELKIWDNPIATINAGPTPAAGTQITLTNPIDGTASYYTGGPYANTWYVETGDWACLSGESVIPALPREMHPVLVRGACLRIAEAMGDAQQAKIHAELLGRDLKAVTRMLTNRVESKPPNISGDSAVLWS